MGKRLGTPSWSQSLLLRVIEYERGNCGSLLNFERPNEGFLGPVTVHSLERPCVSKGFYFDILRLSVEEICSQRSWAPKTRYLNNVEIFLT